METAPPKSLLVFVNVTAFAPALIIVVPGMIIAPDCVIAPLEVRFKLPPPVNVKAAKLIVEPDVKVALPPLANVKVGNEMAAPLNVNVKLRKLDKLDRLVGTAALAFIFLIATSRKLSSVPAKVKLPAKLFACVPKLTSVFALVDVRVVTPGT